LQIIGRLDNPPDWSRADETVGDFGPPDDLQHFVDFAVAVAARYEGRVRHFQVWNEPNLGFEWGNRPVDPYRYTEMLCRTYDALKAVDPEIVVITGALAPTIELNGFNLQDFVYLQQMYNAGASGCFDVLSIQAYGLNSGPTDRRMDPNRVNIARSVYIRDIMVANGDADKPIWISEAAWNSVPTEAEYPGEISLRTAYGQVTQQQAADYITRYYERVNEEWPWIGVVNYWFFTRRDDSESDQAFYYFRMVEPYYDDGRTERPFPPLPVYTAMRAHIATYAPVLYTGVHQADDAWAATTDGEGVSAGGAQFGRAVRLDEGESLTVSVHGTDALIRWRPEGETEWRTERLALSRTAATHDVTLAADGDSALGEGPLLVDSILVADRTFASALGLIVIAVTAALMLTVTLGEAVWRRRQA
jgi:hypothetical protein